MDEHIRLFVYFNAEKFVQTIDQTDLLFLLINEYVMFFIKCVVREYL